MPDFRSKFLAALALLELLSAAYVPRACNSFGNNFPAVVFQPQSGDYDTQVAREWDSNQVSQPIALLIFAT